MGKITMELMLEALAQIEAKKDIMSKYSYVNGLTRSEANALFNRDIDNKDINNKVDKDYTVYVRVDKEES